MGMFDTLVGKCPACGMKIEIQSKGGRCELKTYSLERVPLSVVAEVLDRVITCKRCQVKSQIKPVAKPSFYLSPVYDEESEFDEPEYD